jgi:hypothetical protein
MRGGAGTRRTDLPEEEGVVDKAESEEQDAKQQVSAQKGEEPATGEEDGGGLHQEGVGEGDGVALDERVAEEEGVEDVVHPCVYICVVDWVRDSIGRLLQPINGDGLIDHSTNQPTNQKKSIPNNNRPPSAFIETTNQPTHIPRARQTPSGTP